MNKAVMTRSRLESLCRELQKQNKAIRVILMILHLYSLEQIYIDSCISLLFLRYSVGLVL